MSGQKQPKPGWCQNFSDKKGRKKMQTQLQRTKKSMNGTKKKSIIEM
jgi:hypothetical protein